ncbi:hypothetical protein MUK42_33451 [Musa troglodytarum]|uniref:Uncharacterized protein n=1 Tax=Musa troglodytarum TaxID=320322 RepID=A0A9E7FCC0_9LILI|nr:hypothetical protein MUK42_33451 [Musa troglodytarum]
MARSFFLPRRPRFPFYLFVRKWEESSAFPPRSFSLLDRRSLSAPNRRGTTIFMPDNLLLPAGVASV